MFKKAILIILSVFNLQPNQRCRLNSRQDFREPLPIVLKDGRLLEPTDQYGNIDLASGDTLTLSCESSGQITHPNMRLAVSTASITCNEGDTFLNEEWLSGPSTFSSFRCGNYPHYIAERTNRTCYQNYPIFEVGYKIQNEFHPLYETCFNDDVLTPIYTKYTQKSYNFYFQNRVGREDRIFFISDNLYRHIRVENLFSPPGQKSAVSQRVGGSQIDSYFTKDQFLNRGHLAAKTDFVFAFGQRATFHYVNCAPQWYGFNGGNWNTLEVELRKRIHLAGYDTIIYTGTYEVSQLKDQYGRKVDIYLSTDDNNNPVIPVPMYFYKVVYSPSLKRGTAYVGINNPYYSREEAEELFFCRDVCRSNVDFSWLTWHPDNPYEGYTFCCTIPDFKDTIQHLPYLEVKGLLT